MSENVVIAIISSVPGIVVGIGAWLAARRRPSKEYVDTLNEQYELQKDLIQDHKKRIEQLEQSVAECEAERTKLGRENRDLLAENLTLRRAAEQFHRRRGTGSGG